MGWHFLGENPVNKLWPHQRAGLKWAEQHEHFAVFWEMRLGKTTFVIRHAERWKAGPNLVVCPLSVLPVWQKELEEEGHEAISLRNLDPRTLPAGGFFPEEEPKLWYLVNYEMLRSRRWQHITELPWDLVVLDESTRIKNPKAAVSKICVKGFRRASQRIALTGTPTAEGLIDVVQQMLYVKGHFMGCNSWWQWRHRYYRPAGPWGWEPKPGATQAVKQALAEDALVLSRRDAGIGGRVIQETRYVDLPDKLRKAYRKAVEEYVFEIDEDVEVETKFPVVVDSWLAQISGGEHKDKELLSLLGRDGELYGQPVVVWFRFNSELERIENKLKKAGLKPLSITGSTPVDRRGEICEALSKGSLNILLIQRKCGKYGLNLSRCDTAINFSNGYEAEDRAQSLDRIVHGQKRTPVLILDLVTRNTIDEEIVSALRKKQATTKSVLSQVRSNIRTRPL